MRKPVKKKNQITSDVLYNSTKVEKFTNYLMQDGKKELSRRIVYMAFDQIKELTKNPNPLEVFDQALKNASPTMEVRSRRIGGANYQVPREVRPERRFLLASKWILDATKSKKGSPMYKRLADELVAASNGEGAAVKKKEDTHKMAEANKAFAHFAW